MESSFYLDINGENLLLSEDLNIISGEPISEQHSSPVLLILDQNVSIKHAVIKVTNSEECQIMDICSGITIKNVFNEEEELLPMKWYKLNVGQCIMMGLAEAVLEKNEIIGASPNAETVRSRYSFANKSKAACSFQEVPATEDILGSDRYKLTQDNVYIPETQTLDETLTEFDSYQIKQESQSIFSEHKVENSPVRELLDTFHDDLMIQEHNNHSDSDNRDGSITPELRLEDFTPVVIKQEPLTQNYRQSDVATQIFQPEAIKTTTSTLQSEIATQIFIEPTNPVTKNESLYSCETQQLSLVDDGIKTRKRTKNEGLRISRIETIAVFDIATQPMLVEPINKQIYDVATQVVDVSDMFDSPQATSKKPSRNRIFDSSDEDDDDGKTPVKSISISQEENTPEFIPRFNTGSQMDRDIAEVNLSQYSDDEFSFLISNDSDREIHKKIDNNPVKPKLKHEVVKKTSSRKNLMKFADSEHVTTPKKADPVASRINKRRESRRSSQPEPVIVSKRTSDPPVKQQSISKRRDSLRSSPASIKRRNSSVSPVSPVKDKSKSTRTSVSKAKESSNSKSTKTSERSKLKVTARSSDTSETTGVKTRSQSKSPAPPTINNKTAKRSHSPIARETRNKQKEVNLKRPLAENVLKNNRIKRKCPDVVPDPQYIVAVTNCAERSKIIKFCNVMGFQLNDDILLANVLISNDKIKFTSKFLAAICKGIPIVTFAWLEQCVKNKKPLNPVDFIITDKECEKSKRFSMKKVLQRSASNGFLNNYSVYVTPNTKPLFTELNNILQCAGAECLDLTQKASNSEIIGIANVKDTKEIKELKKRFGSKFKILPDSSVCEVVIHQKLTFNHKCPW
ncbi:unnamed protein product [Diamesa hyperborea]